jgi:hypothetical protein
MTDIIGVVWEYSDRIRDGRKHYHVYEHGMLEMEELREELAKDLLGLSPGEDGIAGEAVDVILCMLDVIYIAHPEMSGTDVLEIVKRKCAKWERKRG